MRILLFLAAFLIGGTVAGEIPSNPDHSILWNRFSAVTALTDMILIAGSNDGLAVLRYANDTNSVKIVKQIFLDDGVQSFKKYGNTVVARTQNQLLYIVDVTTPTQPVVRGRIDLGYTFSDFALRDSSLYIAREFQGLWRYQLSGYQNPHFADSSMLGIHCIQIDIAGDTLYTLDDYNGVLRYSFQPSGAMIFRDFLYVPFQVEQFCVLGGRLALRTGTSQVLLAHFGTNPEIYNTVTLFETPTALFGVDNLVLAYNGSTRLAEMMVMERGFVWRALLTTPIDPLLRCTAISRSDWGGYYAFIAPADVGIREFIFPSMYNDPVGKQLLTRPGPITSIAIGNNRLYTAGQNNPLDLYDLSLDGRPTYDATLYPEFTKVSDLQLEPDSLFVLFDQIQRAAIFEPSADTFIYAGGIATQDLDPTRLLYRPKKLDTVRPLIVYQEEALALYGLTDSGIPIYGYLLGAPARITEVGMVDSLLLIGTTKGIWIYRVFNNLEIEFRSKISAVIDCREMRELNGRMLVFDNNRMLVVNLTNPRDPIVDSTIVMPTTAYASARDGDFLYTVGPLGLCRFDISEEYPFLVDVGGRAGTIVAASNGIVATSDGTSLHIYDLRGVPTDIDEVEVQTPSDYALEQNYPNPFNPNTTIAYSLPEAGQVELVVYNLLGQRVITLVDEHKGAGRHSVDWSGRSASGEELASGIYFYRLRSGDFNMSRKMMMIK